MVNIPINSDSLHQQKIQKKTKNKHDTLLSGEQSVFMRLDCQDMMINSNNQYEPLGKKAKPLNRRTIVKSTT
jgi:hypothetical protein